jgi:serine/threonine protein phosphatase 1
MIIDARSTRSVRASRVSHTHCGPSRSAVVTRGKTNLDSFAWETGRLVVGVFNDDEPGPASDYLEILGQPL